MNKKVAIINYYKCRPEECGSVCKAVKACTKKSLKQEQAGQPPLMWGLCGGCFKCIGACLRGAIEKSK
ncbi:MAG: hypothetical protein K9H14_03875 [Actinomycetia bacterium]|nr:hypothetical protein [Actinomycetes bacterium]